MSRSVPIALVLVLAPIALSGREVCAAKAWEKQFTREGVTVWARDVDGSPNPETKAVTRIDASTDDLWTWLNEEETLYELQPTLVDYRVLGTCGDGCTYVYQRFHRPPIRDRHYVLEVRWKKTVEDGLATYRRWTKTTGAVSPPVQGPLLIEHMKGSWAIRPVDGGARSKMTVLSHLEIGGKVPPAIFNPGAIKNAFKFLRRIREAF